MAQKGGDSSWWCAEIVESLCSVVFPACHNPGQVSVRHIAAKAVIEVAEERCTFDEIGRWCLGLECFR